MKRNGKNLSLSHLLRQARIFRHDAAARALFTFINDRPRMLEANARKRFLICDGVAELLFAHGATPHFLIQ